MDNLKFNYEKDWIKPVNRIGRITMILASLSMFIPVIYLCSSTGVWPKISEILQGWGMSAAAWGVFYFVEPLTYYAVIGLSGTYLGFLAGNIGNMRIPCAATALEVTGVEPGSNKGEIIATIAMGGSVVTNICFTILAALLGTAILSALPESVVNAFSNYTVPAIFGAIVGQFSAKNLRIGVSSIAVALLLKTVIKPPAAIEMLLSVILVVIIARIFYKSDKKEEVQ